MSREHELQALAQAIGELREEPLPDLDWTAMEERLMEQTRNAPPGPERTALPWALGLGGLAAAAAAALWLGSGAAPADEPVAETPAPASERQFVDGAALELGETIRAVADPVRVQHAGRATWTLAPGSEGRIADRGRFLTVALERGSILAEVVPGQAAESFAVEAHQTRVASHGTVFSVTLSDDHVDVQVSEGEIVIGSADDRGRTRGFHLSAPGRGAFALDGARVGRISPQDREPSETPRLQLLPTPRVPDPPPAALPVTSAQPSAPAELSAEAVTDRLVHGLRRCFVEHTHVHGSVHVSATSTLSVRFANGAVNQIRLDPPLAPDVEQCTRQAAQSIDALLNGPDQTLTREVWLTR